MKDMVFLEYAFLFDPSSTYPNLSQFEKDLSAFFKAKNLEACIVTTVDGQIGRRILMLKPIDPLTIENVKQDKDKEKQKSPKEMMDKVMKKAEGKK